MKIKIGQKVIDSNYIVNMHTESAYGKKARYYINNSRVTLNDFKKANLALSLDKLDGLIKQMQNIKNCIECEI